MKYQLIVGDDLRSFKRLDLLVEYIATEEHKDKDFLKENGVFARDLSTGEVLFNDQTYPDWVSLYMNGGD